MDKIKIHLYRGPNGRCYCPTCGHEISWDSSESQSDRGLVPEEDTSAINYYHCHWCGASFEQFEATDEEKSEYPLWNADQKDRFQEISSDDICSICGGELTLENTMMQEDCGLTNSGNAKVYIKYCKKCGSHNETYECPDNLKGEYDFWKTSKEEE